MMNIRDDFNSSKAKQILTRFPMSVDVLMTEIEDWQGTKLSPHRDVPRLIFTSSDSDDIESTLSHLVRSQLFSQLVANHLLAKVSGCQDQALEIARVCNQTALVDLRDDVVKDGMIPRYIAEIFELYEVAPKNTISPEIMQTIVSLGCLTMSSIILNNGILVLCHVCAYYQNTPYGHYFKTMIHPLFLAYNKQLAIPASSDLDVQINLSDLLLIADAKESPTECIIIANYYELEFKVLHFIDGLMNYHQQSPNALSTEIERLLQIEFDQQIKRLVPLKKIKQQQLRTTALKFKDIASRCFKNPTTFPLDILIKLSELKTTDPYKTKIDNLTAAIKDMTSTHFNLDRLSYDVEKLKSLTENQLTNQIELIQAAHSQFERLIATNPSHNLPQTLSQQTEDDSELIGMIESDLQQLTQEKNELTATNDQLYGQVTILQHQLEQLSATPRLSDDLRDILFGHPTLRTILHFISTSYPFITISDELKNQLEKNQPFAFTNKLKILKVLDLICNDYRSAIIKGSPDSVAKSCLGAGYNPTLVPSVMRSKSLTSKRMFTVEGEKKPFQQHITLGSPSNKSEAECCQIYFALNENKNVEFGYIGRHLPI